MLSSNKQLLSVPGVISIAEQLDYERAKDYFLTIQAVDGGTPPLSNHATVNISVTDSNDNAPIFNQASYSARIREDAQIGDKILQVIYKHSYVADLCTFILLPIQRCANLFYLFNNIVNSSHCMMLNERMSSE